MDITGPDTNLTVEKCRAWAAARGYPLFGLQSGAYCLGSDRDNKAMQSGCSQACAAPCGGNGSQTCGGDWANSLYKTTGEPDGRARAFVRASLVWFCSHYT